MHEAGLVAAIVALAIEGDAVEGLACRSARHRVGQLDLAAGAFRRASRIAHHLGLEDVAADHAEVGRRLLGLRLLDQALRPRSGGRPARRA